MRITESQLRNLVREELEQVSSSPPQQLVGKLHANPYLYNIYKPRSEYETYYIDVPMTIEWIGGPANFTLNDIKLLKNNRDPEKARMYRDFEARLKAAFERIPHDEFTFHYDFFTHMSSKPSWKNWMKVRDRTVRLHKSGERVIGSDDVLLGPQVRTANAQYIASGLARPKPGVTP